jgi:thioester reductase-like protein
LVRGKSELESKERFDNIFDFYFNNKEYHSRMEVIKGDVSLEKMGLDADTYYRLGEKIDNIIHTAALVKYYGQYSEFEKVNIDGVRNVMNFAKGIGMR